MSEYTEVIELPDHKLGDRWGIIQLIGPVLVNDVTPSATLARVRMQFRKGPLVFTLDSLDEGSGRDAVITITDAVNWEATVPEVLDFLPESGDWSWDTEFYETGKSRPLTLYKGVLIVRNDITKVPI